MHMMPHIFILYNSDYMESSALTKGTGYEISYLDK